MVIGKTEVYMTNKFIRSAQSTCYNQRVVVRKGDKINVGDLLIDGETGFDFEKRGVRGIGYALRNITPEQHLAMCRRTREQFDKMISFDMETEVIKVFMDNLL